MENTCLTFATPTLIAGDKSAVEVVAHEISHVSVSGLDRVRAHRRSLGLEMV